MKKIFAYFFPIIAIIFGINSIVDLIIFIKSPSFYQFKVFFISLIATLSSILLSQMQEDIEKLEKKISDIQKDKKNN